jgi:nonsense-mediated mRNA decay protein 3
MLICPKCGKGSDTTEFFEAFCVDCYPFQVKIPKGIRLEKCKACSRIRLKGEWQGYDRKRIEEHVASKARGDFVSAEFDLESSVCSFVFGSRGKETVMKENVDFEIHDTTCPDCSRASGGYFEAIIQLRGEKEKVERKAQKLGTELGRRTFISKWEEMHGGQDLYVGSTRIVFETLQKVGLKPSKISKKLTGRREGKKMYRTTFAVRI